VIVGLVLVLVVLSGCGGGDNDAGDGSTPDPTPIAPNPAPRSRSLPSGEPFDFEAPVSAGDFVRGAATGRATGIDTGGFVATYAQDGTTIALTVYAFGSAEEAVDTVRYALNAQSILHLAEESFYGRNAAYGIGQLRQGGYLAAWSHETWCFLARTNGDLNSLKQFLEDFPY
jgi:hypothetical protein